MEIVLIPNEPGFWKHIDTGDIIEVYEFTPAGKMLCIWGPDEGITGTEQNVWNNDEWQDHIPVDVYVNSKYLISGSGWVLL